MRPSGAASPDLFGHPAAEQARPIDGSRAERQGGAVTGAGQGSAGRNGLAFAREGAHVMLRRPRPLPERGGGRRGAHSGVKAAAVPADLRETARSVAVAPRRAGAGPDPRARQQCRGDPAKAFLESGPPTGRRRPMTVTGTLRITHAVARGWRRRAGLLVNLMNDSGRVGESASSSPRPRASTVGSRSRARSWPATASARTACRSLVQTDNSGRRSRGRAHEESSRGTRCRPAARRHCAMICSGLAAVEPTTSQVISVNGGYAIVARAGHGR